jgi:hypothetical protein
MGYTVVWIDVDRDGEADMALEKFPMLHWGSSLADAWPYYSDVYWTDCVDLETGEIRWQFPVNSIPGTDIRTELLNTDTYILSVRAADLGLAPGHSRFDFDVTIAVPGYGGIMDISGLHTFDAARPGLHLTGDRPAPMYWDDLDGATIPVTGDRRAYIANGSQGLLLVHHHNANGKRAQVIGVVPTIGEAPRETGGRAIP